MIVNDDRFRGIPRCGAGALRLTRPHESEALALGQSRVRDAKI
ncbi:Hypothetical protein A7982_09244 [Minicystis rosea]|nr:Hypothetical protein A7982_09244 [Minicystis rosea]